MPQDETPSTPEMSTLLPSPLPMNPYAKPKAKQGKRRRKNGLAAESNACWMKVPKNPKPSSLEKRRNDALRRLKVSQSDLSASPSIDDILKQTPRGKNIAIEALRFSQEPLAIAFLEKYDSIPERDRRELPFEAIGIAANLDLKTLLGEIMLAIREHSVTSVKLIAIAAHPKITKARVKFAKQPGGFRDRDKLDEMLGAIKPTAGPTFIGKAFFGRGGDEGPEEDQSSEKLADDLDYVFPDVSIMQAKIQPMRQKVLEAGK